MNNNGKNNGRRTTRQSRLDHREAQARVRGWKGTWPPERPEIDSPADVERYLARLEHGEARAGFLTALGDNLVVFFERLQPEDFERLAAVLLAVAEDRNAAHRSRLRAVQAAIAPLRRALTILPKLERADDDSLQGKLEELLLSFCRALGAESFNRLADVLVELTGPAAKTSSDKMRAAEAALKTVTDAMAMLTELRALQRRSRKPVDCPIKAAQAAKELEEIMAEFSEDVDAEHNE